jgi:hypothetical protein
MRQVGRVKRLVMLTGLAAVAAVASRLVSMAASGEVGDVATKSSLVARVGAMLWCTADKCPLPWVDTEGAYPPTSRPSLTRWVLACGGVVQ